VIRVCVVEDQALVRQGLVSLLALTSDIAVVAEADHGNEAIRVVADVGPDVLILDVRLPDQSGIDVIAALARHAILPPTLLLTTFDDDEALIRGIRAGAKGFLLKDVTLTQLVAAITTLAAGGTMIHPAASARLAQGRMALSADRPQDWVPDPLTRRELEVLRLMAAGLSNREIGHTLQMVEGTVKNHVSIILSKLGARDRTRAVLKSLELGWL
jgi:DNA-binding NarL/FixJ family response regulator